MNRPGRQKSFVLLFILFLAIVYVCVTLAGIQHYVGVKTMDAVKLGVISVLCAIAFFSGREYFRFTGTTSVFVGAMCFLILFHVTELTEEFAAFQSVPFFGEVTLAKRAFETVLMIGCICLFLAGNVLSVREITKARRQLESHIRDLSESKERYQHLLTHTVAGIWRNELRNPMPIDWPVDKQVDYLIDQDSLVEANDVAARMYGYDSADEVMGKTIREIFAHDVEDARTAMRAWVQNNYRLDGCEIRQHVKPGKVRWLLMLGQGIIQDGHLLGSWNTAIDITERKQAEQAILQHQEQLRSLATELCIVEERERRRLATILHDDICQLLVSSKMIIGLLSRLGMMALDSTLRPSARTPQRAVLDYSASKSGSNTWGGEFSMDSDRGRGTRIALTVPMEMNEKRKHGHAHSVG